MGIIEARLPARKESEMAKQKEDLRDLLQDLGKALSDAISDSNEVGRTLNKLQEGGYRLEILLDCKRSQDQPQRLPLPFRKPVARGEPAFQIDVRDLCFLRSIGIDPTRRLRRRRG